MPTGYTAKIADGQTFEEFILSCARAFGALVEMRDEPADAPIPEEFKPSAYHTTQIGVARAKMGGNSHDDAPFPTGEWEGKAGVRSRDGVPREAHPRSSRVTSRWTGQDGKPC